MTNKIILPSGIKRLPQNEFIVCKLEDRLCFTPPEGLDGVLKNSSK